jgi:acetylornithine deacetylase/succinyl-diaminopimelate desuccinylase-like protein
VTSFGTSAHASRPWKGKNALPAVCRLVDELEKIYGPYAQRESWNTTLNFGQLHGGISTNQVCDKAVLKLDYRYPETDSLERIESELTALAQAIDPSMQVEKGATGLPTFTDVTLPVVQKFLQCLQVEYGHEIVVHSTYGASDARHFAPFNIPILMIKPMGGDIHCETEYLEIESTMKFYAGLRRFLAL